MKMKIGDFVKGLPTATEIYSTTTAAMTKGVVTKVNGDKIIVKIIDHPNGENGVHEVDAKYFEVTGHQKPFDREAVFELLKSGWKTAILDYDLRGADLTGALLTGALLTGALLTGALLTGADLRGADLRGADLRGADLRGADLRRADLTGADLRGADLTCANLTGADLRRADLTGADLRGADLDFSCWPLWCGSLNIKADKRLACQLAYHLCSMQCDDAEYTQMRNSILAFANQFHLVCECGKLEPSEVKHER